LASAQFSLRHDPAFEVTSADPKNRSNPTPTVRLAQLSLSKRTANRSATMSQREHESDFLREMLFRQGSAEGHQLQSQLNEAEQRLRCIGRTARFVAFLMALSAAGVGYSLVFLPGIIERRPHFLMQFFGTVLTGCLICLAIYSVTWLWQSHLANRLREQCRQMVLDHNESPERNAAAFDPAWHFRDRMGGMVTASRSLTPAVEESPSRKAP
jgi:hypothetical protein